MDDDDDRSPRHTLRCRPRQTWRSQELETAIASAAGRLADAINTRAPVRPRDPATTDPDPQP
jgi:hypothetical protein